MPDNDTDQPIRLLHLSDIHFYADKTWDSDPVLRALARFIAGEVAQGLVPDLAAITGDMAFSGQAEKYRLARRWLDEKLWPALSAGGSRMDQAKRIHQNRCHWRIRRCAPRSALQDCPGLLRSY